MLTIGIKLIQEKVILHTEQHKGVLLAHGIWLVAVIAAIIFGWTQGTAMSELLPYAGAACVPAFVALATGPFLEREWAQLLLIASWIGLAIAAAFLIAFTPVLALFIAPVATAALFRDERVIEALVLSIGAAALVWIALKLNMAPPPLEGTEGQAFVRAAILGVVTCFVVAALYGAARHRMAADASLARVSADEAETSLVAQDVLEHAPFEAFVADRDGVLSVTEYENLTISDYIHAPEAMRALIQRTLHEAADSGEAQSTTLHFSKAEARGGPQNWQMKVIPRDTDELYIYLRDMNGEQARIEQLEQQRLLAEGEIRDKSLFFAGVSHELRTPLNAIIGFSDMMRSRLFGPLPDKYGEYADLIHDSGQHMLDLIGDVLDMSKIEAGRYELSFDKFDLADVARSAVKMVRPVAENSGVNLTTDIRQTGELHVEADRRAVRQILLNLLSNAIKFTPSGGTASLSVSIKDGFARLQVRDNGVGMSDEDVARIGKPYSQASSARMVDARGSGLGLSLVKSLTELHNGSFRIKSEPDEGTEVTVTLPASRKA